MAILRMMIFVSQGAVKGKSQQFAFLVADNSDWIIKRIDSFNAAADLGLQRTKVISDAFNIGRLFRLYNKNR